MLNSADVHETILTPVICHKHVRCHDGVTLYFTVKFPSVAPKKTRNFKQLIIHTQIATRHLNETPHGYYVIWIASCPSRKRTAISSPLFSILFSQISFTNLKKNEYNAIFQ